MHLSVDRTARMNGEEPGMVPVVTNEPHGIAVIPSIEAYEYFKGREKKANAWVNHVTMRRCFSAKVILIPVWNLWLLITPVRSSPSLRQLRFFSQ